MGLGGNACRGACFRRHHPPPAPPLECQSSSHQDQVTPWGISSQHGTSKLPSPLHTLSPRSMNLIATWRPVVLSSTNWTNPNVPLFRSLICNGGRWLGVRGSIGRPALRCLGGPSLPSATTPSDTLRAPLEPLASWPASCTDVVRFAQVRPSHSHRMCVRGRRRSVWRVGKVSRELTGTCR